eukprot:TRINITY_DN29155_c0_g2_i11.p1 TRINITY_DN29155_c0_g2~~TRINITY_DN29155_c0_g2_i11.p1  ORF type:complete len:178 (-),score=50.67 TRINITY_DN29155_c0_g2_i11:176-709(-)
MSSTGLKRRKLGGESAADQVLRAGREGKDVVEAAAPAVSEMATASSKADSVALSTAVARPSQLPLATEGLGVAIPTRLSAMPPDEVQRFVEGSCGRAITEDAAGVISLLADRFLDDVLEAGARVARHRGSRTLDTEDLRLVLEEQWGVVLPAAFDAEIPQPAPRQSSERQGSVSGLT